MILVSQTSLAALEQAALAECRQDVLNWLYFNAARFGCAGATAESCVAATDRAMALCLPRGIAARSDICRIAMRCLVHGPDFPEGASFAAARLVLDDPALAPDRKVQVLKLVEAGHLPPGGPWDV